MLLRVINITQELTFLFRDNYLEINNANLKVAQVYN